MRSLSNRSLRAVRRMCCTLRLLGRAITDSRTRRYLRRDARPAACRPRNKSSRHPTRVPGPRRRHVGIAELLLRRFGQTGARFNVGFRSRCVKHCPALLPILLVPKAPPHSHLGPSTPSQQHRSERLALLVIRLAWVRLPRSCHPPPSPQDVRQAGDRKGAIANGWWNPAFRVYR